jgi:uncharacterized protein
MSRPVLRAHHFYDHSVCKHRVYLDHHGNPEEREETSVFVQLLWERGIQHEERVVERLAAERTVATVSGPAGKETAEETVRLMRSGADLIYQGVLIHEDRVGRPDLLEKAPGRSRLGDYRYIPIEIKSGSGFEDAQERDRVKRVYAHQVLFYLDLLEAVQGVRPPEGLVINSEGERLDVAYDEYRPGYDAAAADIQEILSGKSYEPVLGGKCKQCHWITHCSGWAREHHDLTQIYFLGEVKYRFYERGIRTVEEMSRIVPAEFLDPSRKIPRVGKQALINYRRRAGVLLQGRPVVHAPVSFPDRPNELFFDIEDDPTQGVVYLYGVLERPRGGSERFRYFLAERPEDEERTFRDFLEYLTSLDPDQAVIYHYAPHEPTTLKRLIHRYGLSADAVDRFKGMAVDVYQEVVSKTDWPLFSYGLKDIAKYLGFKWSAQDASGAASIAWYNEYLKDTVRNRSYLDQIIRYNKEDCEALGRVKDYLIEGR